MKEDLEARAKRVRLLLMDCDGVLTDGRLYFSRSGEELKAFHVRDGEGIVRWHRSGFRTGVVTGRSSAILERRAEELGIEFLEQGAADKRAAFARIRAAADVLPEEVAFIGDDLADLELLQVCGFPAAVSDCAEELKPHAIYRTSKPGGCGAVRELIDVLLKLKK